MRVDQINALVGLPYEDGFDCADFVARAQKELFGRDVVLPGHHPRGKLTQATAIRRHTEELATRIAQEEAVDGDLVLIKSGGAITHVGVLLILNSVSWLLHNSFTIGHSRLQKLSDLPMFGLKIEGFYRWN
jgi:hypothetical protein